MKNRAVDNPASSPAPDAVARLAHAGELRASTPPAHVPERRPGEAPGMAGAAAAACGALAAYAAGPGRAGLRATQPTRRGDRRLGQLLAAILRQLAEYPR
jgi:hypothetical protein